MYNRHVATVGQLRHAPDIAGGDDIRTGPSNVGEFTVAQLVGNLRLQQIVGPG